MSKTPPLHRVVKFARITISFNRNRFDMFKLSHVLKPPSVSRRFAFASIRKTGTSPLDIPKTTFNHFSQSIIPFFDYVLGVKGDNGRLHEINGDKRRGGNRRTFPDPPSEPSVVGRFEIVLPDAADRAMPVGRKILERDIVVFRRIVNPTADLADVFLLVHGAPPFG